MTGHTWIPIKDSFKGSFKVNNERLILISKEKDVVFINNNNCKIKDPSLDIVNDSNPCSIVEYSWNINYEGITDDEIVVKSNAAHLEKVSIEFKPKDGYYLDDGNCYECYLITTGCNSCSQTSKICSGSYVCA